MSVVTASIFIDASPAIVWDTVMDPEQLGAWVTIHRRLVRAQTGPPEIGFTMDQQIHLRGVNLEVHWELVGCTAARRASWEGRGPARSQAHTEYRLDAKGSGTNFDYRNEFRAPLGPVGAIVSRALVGGVPVREANHSLERLKAHIESGGGG
jgi:Polyketide cyclase / dehydrase and lipid transport